MTPIVLKHFAYTLLTSSLVLANPRHPDDRTIAFANTTWDDSTWTIRTSALDQGHYQSRVSLSNGYLGINVASLGPFFEIDTPVAEDNINGWPVFNTRQTFATIAGFYNSQPRTNGSNYPWLYQYGGESFAAGVPHWAGLLVKKDDQMLDAGADAEHVSEFESSLDLSRGVKRWKFAWSPAGGDAKIDVEYEMFVHKLLVNQAAVKLRLRAKQDTNVTVYDVLEGTAAVRSDFVDSGYEQSSPTIWSAVKPGNISDVTAYIYSTLTGCSGVDMSTRARVTEDIFASANASSIAQSVHVSLKAGKAVEITKYIGAASTDAFTDPQGTARDASLAGVAEDFYKSLESHAKEWATILTRDSVDRYNSVNGSLPQDPYLQELHVTSVTNPFMILQNTVGPNAIEKAGGNPHLNIHSIPVCGLGSDCYGGLIFWDAETWMAPGLQVSHPQHVETIVNYRIEKYAQAKENIKSAFESSKNQTGRFTGGAVYPWTSGRFGNCTGTGPCFDYEYHLNGDIAITFRNQFVVTGDADRFKEKLLPISNDIAYFFGEVLDYNETAGQYELWNATDPDEYANNVNSVGFTTALIQQHFNETNDFNVMFGLPPNETWMDIASKMRLPVDEEAGIILEYDTMNGSIVVKQADVILLDDVLHYDNPYTLADLDYYANKQSPDGPGMTYAAFSIVANEISPSGCSSYTYNVYSSHPYIRAPWFQYSEQLLDNYSLNGGTHPAFPFLTGMGGANRVGIFGYLGLRLFVDRLDIDPSLPPQIPRIDYRTFYWQGYGVNATSNATHTTLQRITNATLPTANPLYLNASIPVTLGTRKGDYSLGLGTPLTVPNRLIGQIATVPSNILQCHAVLPDSEQTFVPGQLPFAAIDGASSTKWQPYNASIINYLSVDLGADTAATPIKEIFFDWGGQPPMWYEVLFTNSSLPPFSTTSTGDMRNVTAGYVRISEPYDPKTANVVQPVKGNQTNITLPSDSPVWSGRYAHLGIRGNLGNDTGIVGATVAEWSIVGESSSNPYAASVMPFLSMPRQ